MHFDFISEQGIGRKQRDQATKNLIRKKATQAAAITKRREGTIKSFHSSQLLPWVLNESLKQENQAPVDTPLTLTFIGDVHAHANGYHNVAHQSSNCDVSRGLPPPICPESIPSILSAPLVQDHLVGFLQGKSTLQRDHMRISKMLKLSDPDFLCQLSAKYGQSPTLDSAILCLVARIKEILNAPVQIESPRYLYGRALHSLQKSLCHGATETLEDLWFTTPTLALFELLDASSHAPWILHTKGAAQMLKRVGPQRITTESQKILLATQMPIMIIEALISGDSCFLAEHEWQMALESIITEGQLFHFRSEMIVHLFKMAAKIPNLFNKVTDCIRTRVANFDLQCHLLEVKSAYALWNTRWKSIISRSQNNPEVETKRLFHRANAYGYAAIIDRLLLAMNVAEYLELEPAALSNACNATAVAGQTKSTLLEYARVISNSVIGTTAQWQEHCMFATEQMVAKDVFLEWARAIERPV